MGGERVLRVYYEHLFDFNTEQPTISNRPYLGLGPASPGRVRCCLTIEPRCVGAELPAAFVR